MNYRHAYHAGNFADVMKHAVYAMVLEHLKQKEKPFFVLDTHAGTGKTDLSGIEAQKTGEFRQGIARIMEAGSPHPLLKPYLATLTEMPESYPGSPTIAARLSRSQDRLAFCELHPEDADLLRENYRHDRRIKTHEMDGYAALKAMLPPPERRGVVLIDPPFEERNEYERLINTLKAALTRWATGTLIVWYPVKDPSVNGAFLEQVTQHIPTETLRLELQIMASNPSRMTGSGLLIVNPPYSLTQKTEAGTSAVRELLEWLLPHLSQGKGSQIVEEWLTPETD